MSKPDEYASLREETLKRVELQDRISNLTILTAGAVLTFATAGQADVALCAYPIVVLFLASSYAYNSMMLITLGCYIRDELEGDADSKGWATFLKGRYYAIEHLERISKYGLFVAVPVLVLVFEWVRRETPFQTYEMVIFGAGCGSILLTLLVLWYPEYYHRNVLTNPARAPTPAPRAEPE